MPYSSHNRQHYDSFISIFLVNKYHLTKCVLNNSRKPVIDPLVKFGQICHNRFLEHTAINILNVFD